MPRATSPESESESERVPSKKQKKREEKEPEPVDDPMDEDTEEYEIEKVMDSSREVFVDGEMAYFVKWRGFPESENSWVRESDAPNADELISAYLDTKSTKTKKAAAKPRKSTEPRKSIEPPKQEPKKRGRVSTKSKAESDEEEPEQSPVQPITKKQKKAPVSTKKKKVEEASHDDDDVLDMEGFTSMDKYMHIKSWDDLVDSIDTIEKDGDGNLFVYGTLTTKEHFRLPSTIANARFPQKTLKFYENNLRWKSGDEAA